GAQSVPQLLVDAERQYGARFMEAGVIIELRHFVQAQDHVVPRTNPFARVDCARFQGSRDFSPRKIDDDGAEPPQDLAAQTWHAVTQGGVASYARELTLGQMPVAHQPPAAIIGELVGMAAEQARNLSLDGLRQKRSRAVAQNLGQRIGKSSWLRE